MKTIGTYEDAVAYLKEYIPFTLFNTDAYKKTETHDPLDRMRYFLNLLDHPEKKFKSILIGGTSGKGSTSYLLSHILTTAGYKTGLTLSPHIVTINERIQLNGIYISNEQFLELVKEVQPAVEKMVKESIGAPSYFEITVGMAFLYFAKQHVDIAVVEVGMGGEYDATNVLEPLIAVLTNVSLDHTQFLGGTVEEIAKTKVGIIKNYELGITNYELKQHIHAPIVITGVTQPSVIEIVENQTKRVGAKLYRLGKDFSLTNFEIGLPGEYQKENASLALEAVKQLKNFDFSIDDPTIRKALESARFTGRFELKEYLLHNTKYKILLDGAHNTAKMHAFVASLQKAYPKEKKIFVIAFKKDKNIESMLTEVIPVADMLIVTHFQIGTDTMTSNASMESDEIIQMIKKLGYTKKLFVEHDSGKALEKAIEVADENSVITVTGSLYLIGELKQQFFMEAQ